MAAKDRNYGKPRLPRTLITGGCSFTAHQVEETLSWANQLDQKYDNVINTAEMASGNQIICDRICYELSKPEVTSENTMVAVMWSSPWRKEFLLTSDYPDWQELWQKFHRDKTGFSNYILTDKPHEKHPTSNWLIVGGGYGIWNYEVNALDAKLENYFRDIWSPEEAYVSTLRAMITVQALCEAKRIPLLNMTWQSIFHDLGSKDFESEESFWKKDIVSTTGWLYTRLRTAFSNRLRKAGLDEQELKSDMHNKRIDRLYPNTKHWFELVDWGTWHFYENDLVEKGGLQEYSHFECGTPSEELKVHPSKEVQKKWLNRIMKVLEEKYGMETN